MYKRKTTGQRFLCIRICASGQGQRTWKNLRPALAEATTTQIIRCPEKRGKIVQPRTLHIVARFEDDRRKEKAVLHNIMSPQNEHNPARQRAMQFSCVCTHRKKKSPSKRATRSSARRLPWPPPVTNSSPHPAATPTRRPYSHTPVEGQILNLRCTTHRTWMPLLRYRLQPYRARSMKSTDSSCLQQVADYKCRDKQ